MTWSEQTLILGSENHLVATVTIPADSAGRPKVVAVLTNSGVIPRTGPHRMNVHLARRFAEMGIPSIRFDMSGLGDSRRSGSDKPVSRQWVDDTRQVMDIAEERFGCGRFFMVGFCSGAEVAHRVALEDRRLRAVVLWDLYSYPTMQSKLRIAMYRVRRAGLASLPRKVIGRVVGSFKSGGRSNELAVDQEMDFSHVPSIEEYAGRIQQLVDSGVELLFAYSGGEPEGFNHRGQFRGMFGRFDFVNKVAFNYLEISDHLVTRREAQQSFTAMVVQWLEQRVLVASAPAR